MSEQAKKALGQVAYEAANIHGSKPWAQAWPSVREGYAAIESAVIAAHEAAKWRPMSEQDEVPTRALLAYEVGSKRYVTACVIDWRYDDSQPERYISDDDSEPIFVPGAIIALAWQHMPAPPEVPR